MESNRWWEFYFIRYFVGSVFGSLVVMALAFHPDSSLSVVIASLFQFSGEQILELKSDQFWVILSFGVAFCYIASAPILVIHALRAQFDFQSTINTDWKDWVFRLSLVTIPLALLFFIFKHHFIKFIFLMGYTLVIVFQLIFLAPALKNKFDSIFKYYKELAKNRAKDAGERKQYIESYRHLREHGNAFLILFCELMLGSALFISKSLSEALIILLIWLCPTIPVWFLGTFLESKVKDV